MMDQDPLDFLDKTEEQIYQEAKNSLIAIVLLAIVIGVLFWARKAWSV